MTEILKPSTTTFTFTILKKHIWDAFTRYYSMSHAYDTTSPLSVAIASALGINADRVYVSHSDLEIFVIVYNDNTKNYEDMFRLSTADEEMVSKLLKLYDSFVNFAVYGEGAAPKGGFSVILTKVESI